MPAPRSLGLAALLAVALGALLPAARVGAQDLASAQAALARYDLADPRTYDALETLRRLADANGADAPTARAVRAYAGVDLLVAATLLEDGAALARLGAALGATDRSTQIALLEQQLARTPSGALAVAAAEAQSTLAAFAGTRGRRSVRSDAIVLLTAPSDEAGLRARVRDRFDPVVDADIRLDGAQGDEARRLAAAVRATRAALRAAEAGDPLLALLRAPLEAVLGRLTRVVIERIDDEAHDVVARITPTALTLGYVTRARVDAEGQVTLLGGAPRLPETVSIPFPGEMPPVVRPIDAIAQHPAVSGAVAGTRVLLAIDEGVPSHLVARVVRSLEGSPLVVARLDVGNGSIGVRFVREDALATGATRIAVRPGGYVIEGRRRTEVPRIRVEGRFRFDHEGLARELARLDGPRVVSGFPATPASELVAAARLAQLEGEATILLP
jgi:hypothetical protein